MTTNMERFWKRNSPPLYLYFLILKKTHHQNHLGIVKSMFYRYIKNIYGKWVGNEYLKLHSNSIAFETAVCNKHFKNINQNDLKMLINIHKIIYTSGLSFIFNFLHFVLYWELFRFI